ncbi:MAG: PKD domain-containing protein [Bacteroidota bacterium]
MKHKGLLKNVFGLAIIMVFSLFISSCGEDVKPVPTITVVINSIDGFIVDIAAEAENATSWSWDYGDGNTSDTDGGHFYTYTERGDFTITCTVTGEGGSTTKTVDVHIATKEELLTGNTWVLSETGTNGLGFHITTDLVIDIPTVDILETLNGLRDDATETYDFTNEVSDEYTFNADGSYSIDYVNDNVLTSWVYANVEGANIVGTCSYVGIFVISSAALTNATWTLHENEDLTLNTVYDASLSAIAGGVAETVEFVGVDYLTFTNDGFLGVKDYTSTALIRSISKDELAVTVFFHGYYGYADPDNKTLGLAEPSFLINLTFKPKA